MKLIDGKKLAAEIRTTIAAEIRTHEIHPTLAVLLVGSDAASRLYVGLKEKAAAEVGIRTIIERKTDTIMDDELITLIQTWNNDPNVDAILVQLPLPSGHDETRIVNAIQPSKDADGFHPTNREKLLRGEGNTFPPLHEGILRLIATTGIHLNGAKATLIGNSDAFLEPLSYLLTRAGCVVESMKPADLNVRGLKESNVVVTAVGRSNFLTSSMTAEGAVVIDVGTNRRADGSVCGDVDEKSFHEKDGWLTPVPGGVGPMTVAMLLASVLQCATAISPRQSDEPRTPGEQYTP